MSEVIVNIKASGVNRADLMQAKGHYPPPPGVTAVLGLELAGIVEETGERVAALVQGGGYGDRLAVERDILLHLPDHMTFEQGAAIPEAWLTAFVNLFLEGALAQGESVLIHAGASGVGLAAIQLARDIGAKVYITVRSEHKAPQCVRLGAEVAMVDSLPKVDLILDCVGGSYLEKNIAALNQFGRLVNIGLMGGSKATLDLSAVLRKRLKIIGSTLRSRPREEQIAITRKFRETFWPKIVSGQFEVTVDKVFPKSQTAEAHRYMEENRNTGKIILTSEESSAPASGSTLSPDGPP
jgi:putative PIG3 family NAD(P)H quinone oxidoreductase